MSLATGRERGRERTASSPREALYARAARQAIPLRVVWEVTKRCNLKCSQCYVGSPGAELPTARCLALVDELADAGCMSVTLTGGEVGLRPDLLELAAKIRRRRMLVYFFTNGTVMTDGELRALAALGPVGVAVSMYGADAVTHESVTRVRGSFARSVATLRLLRSLGVSCRVHGVLVRETAGEFTAIAELAESLGCEWRFDPSVTPSEDGCTDVLSHRVSMDELRGFFQHPKLAGKTKEYVASHRDPSGQVRHVGNCGAGIVTAYIAADGAVYPCMGFPPAFGNVAQVSFAAAWRSPEAEAHRQRMREPLPHCSACELEQYCTTRCPRVAAVEDGDMTGPSKRACEMANLVRDWRDGLLAAG